MAKQSLGFSTPTFPLSTFVRQHLLVNPQSPMVKTKTHRAAQHRREAVRHQRRGRSPLVRGLQHRGRHHHEQVQHRARVRSLLLLQALRGRVEAVPGRDAGHLRGPLGRVQHQGLQRREVLPPPRRRRRRHARGHRSPAETSVIGRTSPPRFMEEYKEFEIKGPYRRDTSVAVRPTETGVVDSVFMTENVEGGKMYKVRVQRHEDPRDRGQVRVTPRAEGSGRTGRPPGGHALHRGRRRPRRHNQPARVPFEDDRRPVHRVDRGQGRLAERLLGRRHRASRARRPRR